MKYRLLMLLPLLLWLGGCAVIDLSQQDTAEIQKPGHVKVQTYVGSGLVLDTPSISPRTTTIIPPRSSKLHFFPFWVSC